MKIISAILLASIMMSINYVSINPEDVIIRFINDLKETQMSNHAIVEKYFTFREEITQKEKQETILPILTKQLDLLRKKINEDCSRLEVIKHNENLAIVETYKLRHSNFNNVYYVTCGGLILTPVLIDKNKISSITTHSKRKDGTKGFMVY